MRSRRIIAALLLAPLAAAASAAAQEGREAVDAGALRATVGADPWALRFDGPAGQATLAQAAGAGGGPTGALGFRSGIAWWRATRVLAARRDGDAYEATLATTDPLGRRIDVRIAPAGDGVIALVASVTGPRPGVDAVGIAFVAPARRALPGLRRALQRRRPARQRGRELRRRGPVSGARARSIAAFVPLPGYRPRDDATYFPIPWLLSAAGYGVLVDNDETSTFALGTDRRRGMVAWPSPRRCCALRVFAGPRPADALRRFSARVGRQPPAAAPFFFGPWWQPAGDEGADLSDAARGGRRRLGRPDLHALPAVRRPARGARAAQRGRTRFHAAGLAVTTYFNPMVCTELPALRRGAGARRADPQRARPALRVPLHGLGAVPRRAVRLHRRGGGAFYGDLLDEAVAHGYDGWMEDFGEYTPLDAHVGRRDRRAPPAHNRYVAHYHCAAHALRPRARAAAAGALQPLGLDRRRPAQRRSSGAATRRRAGASTACARPCAAALTMGLSGV